MDLAPSAHGRQHVARKGPGWPQSLMSMTSHGFHPMGGLPKGSEKRAAKASWSVRLRVRRPLERSGNSFSVAGALLFI